MNLPSYRHPSEGWGPCLSRYEMASEKKADMDSCLRRNDEEKDGAR